MAEERKNLAEFPSQNPETQEVFDASATRVETERRMDELRDNMFRQQQEAAENVARVRNVISVSEGQKRSPEAEEPLGTQAEMHEAINYFIGQEHGVPMEGTAAHRAMQLADAYEGGQETEKSDKDDLPMAA